MTDTILDLDDARTRTAHDALEPYLQLELERAARHAWKLHAEEVSPEHLFTVIMADDDSAAHQTVLFGFADPPTLAVEALALSPGILVVGSGTSLPFSPRGVRALFDARERAASASAAAVEPAHLLAASIAELPADARARLEDAGYDEARLLADVAASDEPLEAKGALFASFDTPSRRTLGLSCRLASRASRPAISPSHIAQACVESAEELAGRAGLGPRAVATAVAQDAHDPSEPEPRRVPVDDPLATFLGRLPSGAGTLEALEAYCAASAELGDILRRNRIGHELVARARGSFRDPAAPPG